MKRSSSSSSLEVTANSDMKDVIKVVLLRVANKTTSRYGVTLFLFCSSVWLLTQSFLALHNGCWISNPQVLSRIKDNTKKLDCDDSHEHAVSSSLTSGEHTFGKQQRVRVAVNDAEVFHHENSRDNKSPLDDQLVVGGAPELRNPIARKDEAALAKRSMSEATSARDDIKPTPGTAIKDVQRANVSEWKQTQDSQRAQTHLGTSDIKQIIPSAQPTRKPYRPLPSGAGVPALLPGPYNIPENTTRNIVKITKQSWETMGCIKRVTIFVPGVNNLPKNHIWKEIAESFKKYQMGYYLLKCPDQVCDLIIRTGALSSTIKGSNALLVGATTRTFQNKTKAVMQELYKRTSDNPINIYLFTLDNSPMMNHYEPYMANFEYHYSMTYHSQADVPIPYGRYLQGVGAEAARNWAEGKTALVAWVEDNCDKTFWPRLEYVHELRKHIPIKIYGKCGDQSCASMHCQEELKSYKFYLALEEAPCDEFITMAFWQRALAAGAVPIVYGGKNYSYVRVAPPNSFIHINDFNSPADLAHYLMHLSASDVEYNRYHQWRTEGSVEVSEPGFKLDSFCHMVPQLIHLLPPRRKVMSRGKFYRSCRKGIYVNGFSSRGDLSNWTPWRW